MKLLIILSLAALSVGAQARITNGSESGTCELIGITLKMKSSEDTLQFTPQQKAIEMNVSDNDCFLIEGPMSAHRLSIDAKLGRYIEENNIAPQDVHWIAGEVIYTDKDAKAKISLKVEPLEIFEN